MFFFGGTGLIAHSSWLISQFLLHDSTKSKFYVCYCVCSLYYVMSQLMCYVLNAEIIKRDRSIEYLFEIGYHIDLQMID